MRKYSTVGAMVDQAIVSHNSILDRLPVEYAVRLDAFVRRCLPHLSRRAVEQAIGDKLFRIQRQESRKKGRS